jgi:hypothetical protein
LWIERSRIHVSEDTKSHVRKNLKGQNLWAIENSESCFPDGRYRVGLTAESHTGKILSEYLPEDGVIIDNFIPHIDRVIALHLYSDNITNITYTGRWKTQETPSSAWRKLVQTVEGYLLPREFGKSPLDALGIVVHFSEPMNMNDLPSVWLEGEWGGEMQWSSLDNQRLRFSPSPMPDELVLQLSPEADTWGHWVYYESEEYSYPGYQGALTICIGDATEQVPASGVGTDLAGNYLDVDPADIEEPLFPPIPVQTPGIDYSHTYGNAPIYGSTVPNYLFPPYPEDMVVLGAVIDEDDPEDTLYTVDIPISTSYLSLCDYYLKGWRVDCPFYHGCWIVGKSLEYESILGIVKPDGTTPSYNLTGIVNDINSFNPTGDYFLGVLNVEEEIQPLLWWVDLSFSVISRDMVLEIDDVFLGEGYTYVMPPNFPKTQVTNIEWLSDYTVRIDYTYCTNPQGPEIPAYHIETLPDLSQTALETNTIPIDSICSEISDPEIEMQLDMCLSQNPVMGSANIHLSIPITCQASLQVFDLSGRLARTLLSEEVHSGNHTVSWDSQGLKSGIYFIRLTAGVEVMSIQAIVIP